MIQYKKNTDNIVTLTLDMQGRANNIINHEIGAAFLPVLAHLKTEKKRGALRGVIMTSAKKSFLAGGDLEYLYQANNPQEIFDFAQKLKHFFRELESPGVPVVAAINGTALATGFELALACHHRIVIDQPKIKVGHPEINVGLIPGGGGIIRLMWLLGIEKAYPILASGRRYSPMEALATGIIDEVAKDEQEMFEKAKNWLLKTSSAIRPWDRTNGKIPGGTAENRNVAQLIQKLAAQIGSRTHNNFPAQQAILNVLAEGSKVDFDTASKIESRYYTALALKKETKNMIKTFWFDFNAVKEGISRPKGYGKFRPKNVGVIGAGRMGSGIALACLIAGLKVVLKDVSKSIAERGRDYVATQLQQMIEGGTIQEEEAKILLSNIITTETPKDFEACDLVIEAVFENQMVKQKVTREAEAYIDKYAVFASNTISIPITKLAEASLRPENYVGLHFFLPAEKVPLVEIVRGVNTSDETIARAFDFVKKIRKTPIIVKDDWGFYAARVRNTYILEGITMLQEGFPPALIENLGRQTGMPQGALAIADDLGLDMVLKYEKQAADNYGAKYLQHPAVNVLEQMLQELERPGKRKRKGFYEYQDSNKQLWPELQEHFPPNKPNASREEVTERFLFAQVLEAIWCLQEGVIGSVEEANLGSIYGWGFPAFKGGVIQYINDYGADTFIKRCKTYEETHGPRFKAPKKLKKIIGKEQE